MNVQEQNARPRFERRAFSLLELVTVVAIVGVIASMATVRWGDLAVQTTTGEGFARSVKLALATARQQAIAEGTTAAVVLTRTSGAVSSFSVYRVSGSDTRVESVIAVPTGVTVTSASDRWEFSYSGSLSAPVVGGTIVIADGKWNYTLTVNAVTGHVGYAKAL